MSKDVEDIVKQILQMKGMTVLESTQYVDNLQKSNRYALVTIPYEISKLKNILNTSIRFFLSFQFFYSSLLSILARK